MKITPTTIADLKVLSMESQLLLAHCLERNNRSLTLLETDRDSFDLITEGWLIPAPNSAVGVISYVVEHHVWGLMRSLRSEILTNSFRAELQAYRKGKSAGYPWVWTS
ncbi:MAG: hypothetical protein K2W95_27655 [Candidatus Obscuribacterales bacterium]|nr:hypothetical protein [Candidatus Obscuribacterales bacterium]